MANEKNKMRTSTERHDAMAPASGVCRDRSTLPVGKRVVDLFAYPAYSDVFPAISMLRKRQNTDLDYIM